MSFQDLSNGFKYMWVRLIVSTSTQSLKLLFLVKKLNFLIDFKVHVIVKGESATCDETATALSIDLTKVHTKLFNLGDLFAATAF